MKKLFQKLAQIDKDKYMHCLFGMLTSLLCAFLIPTGMYWSVIPAVIVGLAKEIYDKQDYGLFDKRDWFATGLGGLVVNILSILYLIIY